MLYAVFDKFLATDTWHTRHPSDTRQFFLTLHWVVKDPSFHQDELGAYMREKAGVSREGTDDASKHFNVAIDDYVRMAGAVQEYLKANHHTVKST
jgi:hypothetical protein